MYVWAPGVNTENKVLKKKFLPSKSNNDNIKKLYTFGGLKLFESFIVENLNTIDTHTQTQTQDSYGSFFFNSLSHSFNFIEDDDDNNIVWIHF